MINRKELKLNKYIQNMQNSGLSYLSQPDTIKEIELFISEMTEFDAEEEAKNFVDVVTQVFQVHKNFKIFYPEIYKKYKNFYIKAKFIALPLLEKDDILHLLEFDFKEIFDLPDYDLYQKIKRKIITFYDLKERDDFKQQLLFSLSKCNLKITKNKIKSQEVLLEPTIANWIKNYNLEVGSDFSQIKQSQYFISNDNVKNLNQAEIKKIKYLLNFWKKIKIPSNSPEGLEESVIAILPNGEMSIVSDGQFIKIPESIIKASQKFKAQQESEFFSQHSNSLLEQKALQEEKERENKIDELTAMASRFPVGSLERKAVEEELRKYK